LRSFVPPRSPWSNTRFGPPTEPRRSRFHGFRSQEGDGRRQDDGDTFSSQFPTGPMGASDGPPRNFASTQNRRLTAMSARGRNDQTFSMSHGEGWNPMRGPRTRALTVTDIGLARGRNLDSGSEFRCECTFFL
jgi:hypothetical protein